jgi:hypothetical protein
MKIKTFKEHINESQLFDMDMKPLAVGDYVEVQDVAGRYGQTKTYQGKITEIKGGQIVLDDEYTTGSGIFNNGRGFTEFKDYEHGHTKYVKKISKSQLDPKKAAPKLYRPTFTVWLCDSTNGFKDHNKFPRVGRLTGFRSELEKWIKDNYPDAEELTNELRGRLTAKFGKDWRKQYPAYLAVHQSTPGASGYMSEYLIIPKA